MKASSTHDKINLARLLARLDILVHAPLTPLADKPWWEVRKLNDDSKYARELLDAVAASEAGLDSQGEGTSTTLDEYELKLNKISMTLILATSDPAIPKGSIYTVLPPAALSLVPPTSSPIDGEVDSADLRTAPSSAAPNDHSPALSRAPAPAPIPSIISSGLRSIDVLPEPPREATLPSSVDTLGTIAPPTTAFLPDAPPPTAREQLGLRERRTRPPVEGTGVKPIAGGKGVTEGLLSTSRVHDELTEQLAMMSTQLRKNAAYFASSLEAEKPLLEQSSALLESNLTKMTGSKGRLSAVSGKGRSNTWLVLASVLGVCLIWLWMYFVIRFT